MSKDAALKHFLLVFDHKEGRLVQKPLEFADVDQAVAAYSECEARYEKDDRMEVVLIGSDSIETVQQTHSNYFDGTAAIASALAVIIAMMANDADQSVPSFLAD